LNSEVIFSPTFLPIFPGRTETSDRVCFVFEYVSGGELFQHIVSHGRFKETEARRFFRQVIPLETPKKVSVFREQISPDKFVWPQKYGFVQNTFNTTLRK